MDAKENLEVMLQQINSPAFLVSDGIITAVNQQAATRFLAPQMAVADQMITGQEEYAQFHNGCLFLKLSVDGNIYNCNITHLDSCQLFTIEEDSSIQQLQALSLAAQQLSVPVTEISLIMDQLQELEGSKKSQLNKNLFRLKRILGNMADAAQFASAPPRFVTCELCSVFAEILEKAKNLLFQNQITVIYHIPKEPVYGLANTEMLKRAIYNLLSNAAKFSSAGDTIEATLKHRGNILSLTVVGGHGQITGDLFHRYNRQPALESRDFGLGLGMSLVHSAAAAHGGTVLIEQPSSGKFKITMTLKIQQSNHTDVRSPILVPDIYGGRDQALVELSDVLPHQLYDNHTF